MTWEGYEMKIKDAAMDVINVDVNFVLNTNIEGGRLVTSNSAPSKAPINEARRPQMDFFLIQTYRRTVGYNPTALRLWDYHLVLKEQ